MRSIILLIILNFTCLLSHPPAHCQIIETPRGKAEVLGLKVLTLQQVLDTLSVKLPGASIDKCATNLKYIGFPEASVKLNLAEEGKFYTVVTLVEPQYANFVKYKEALTDTLAIISDWQPGIEIFKNNHDEFHIGLINYGIDEILKESSDFAQNFDIEKIRKLWEFLSQHSHESNREMAIWILNNDGNYLNRSIAAALLINFSESDLVWWNLMESLRDPDARVSSAGRSVLEYFAENRARNINWQPAIISLHYLINGTNLFAFDTVLKVLTKTNLSEKLFKRLIDKSKGHLILSYLKANHKDERELAYRFLTKLTGKDFGYDATKWEALIVSLSDQK